MSIIGSYHNGFAPRDGQPLYPELWRGCVGAWAPCLGPTGLTLRDWAPSKNNGAFTNMTAADWATSQGRYSLTFGSTKTVAVSASDVASLSLVTQKTFTILAWILPSSQSGFPVVYSYGRWRASLGIQVATSRLSHWRNNSVEYTSSAVLALNTLQCVAISNSNADAVTFWINGRSSGTSTGLAAVSTGAASSIGNTPTSDGGFTGQIFEVRLYNRELSSQEHMLFASRIGIAYDLAPRKRTRTFAGGFKAYWAARKALIQMAGST